MYEALHDHLLALVLRWFALVGTVEEFTVEQLYRYDGEDEMKEHVHDQNVDNVFQRIHHTVENRF